MRKEAAVCFLFFLSFFLSFFLYMLMLIPTHSFHLVSYTSNLAFIPFRFIHLLPSPSSCSLRILRRSRQT
jgi:hypothetical protein